MPSRNDPYASALIAQGVDYSTAEDKAYMATKAAQNADESDAAYSAEAAAHGALEATIKALALYLRVEYAQANELILSASD